MTQSDSDDGRAAGDPQPLDYQPPPSSSSSGVLPVAVQALLGAVAWFAVAGLFGAVVYAVPPKDFGIFVIAAVASTLVTVLCAGLFQLWIGWTGFVPGVLIGVLLTCLVPVGLVYTLCGSGLQLR